MHSTKELTAITLYINYTPKLEIMRFPILELVAKGGRMETIRAYTNPKGKDISSLKAEIVSLDGCNIAHGSSITSFTYDIKEKCAILRLDMSKIFPNKVNGYIHIKVSGNYGFCQILKLPWTVYQEVPQITEDWLNIDMNNEPILWKTGDVFVAEISLSLPSEIQNNLIWYLLPEVSLNLGGNDNKNFILECQSNSKYNLYFNCQGTIEEPIRKEIKLLIYADNVKVWEKELVIDLNPAKRFVEPTLTICTDEYVLGTKNTQLAELKLLCKSDDKKAKAKVMVSIKCNDTLIECGEGEVDILASASKNVNINVIREKLTKLPTDDIPVEVVVKSCNQYTEVSDFSGFFKLTK